MNKRITKVTVRAPATTANMGPGFDSIGMALDIFNTITVEQADAFGISITGQGVDTLSRGVDNMVYRGFQAVFSEKEARTPTVQLSCHNEIPLRRGLGSSAAAVTGGLLAGNLMSGAGLPM
ncbi:MAG: homoserine kinase, partial [Dehalococcoidia bacterium]